VSLMPNDLVIFRNESADALRKLCNGLRWAIVSDTAIAMTIWPTERNVASSQSTRQQQARIDRLR
jgi:hypothetical protein